MKNIIFIFLIFLLPSGILAQEGKQENIIRIEKQREQTTVIQNPLKQEILTNIDEKTKKITEEPKIKKPIYEPKKLELKFVERNRLKEGWKLYEEGKYEESLIKFKNLIHSTDREISNSARLGVAYSLKNLNKNEEALLHFEELWQENYRRDEILIHIIELYIKQEDFERAEIYANYLKESDRKPITNKIREAYLQKKFESLSPKDERSAYLKFKNETEEMLKECIGTSVFFELSKKLALLKENQEAVDILNKLLQCVNEDLQFRLGIIYEYTSLVSFNQALEILKRESYSINDKDYLDKIKSIEINLYRQKLASLDLNSPEVEKIANKILKFQPEDKSAKTSLAWYHFNKKEYEKALDIFTDLNKQYPDEEDYILGISYCYFSLNKDDELIEFAEKVNLQSPKLYEIKANSYIRKADKAFSERDFKTAFLTIDKLSKQKNQLFKQRSAQWYCRQGFFLLASHTDLSKEACYYKEKIPHFETGFFYRQKSGDEGSSKLKEFSLPLSFHYPIESGKKLTFTVIPKYVNSGEIEKNPYLGNYYYFLNGTQQKNTPVTSKWLIQPDISYEVEGYPHIKISVGSTPLNGLVSAMPTFSINVDYKKLWFNIHQLPIEESILSIQGQKDPYTNTKWGRVLKTGISTGLNFSFSNSYWTALSTDFNYIWGKNVWENYSLTGNLSFGKTFILNEKSQFDAGLFYVIQHFRRNSNFFTFGHGGYFSPQLFQMIGPTFRYQVRDCCENFIDLRLSFGYLYYRTDNSPHYPKFQDSIDLFNPSAQNDIKAFYAGEKKSKFGGTLEGKIKHSINKNLKIYGYGVGNISGGYNEWKIGLGLIYYFD
ncbi:MAG: cellulose synthase subunit BcsC-related outer membrane protein [Thermodesulfovibrio sp.]|uniref:cellulose synthase subunit BcsC-related outer membrane protein n=1 Tax=Thermodesulfovibrio sp. N1 TaxID=1871110 RepID=UPI00083AA5A5|nr:cellulose synthase subunit BcsC-related outer membrane protein [Thermodesulfovibrio sp. N1]MDI6713419.1 cellulose synthase subunit BcsC-related outer membrane protein [Thermodesulfovibrio sp.]ODA43592.1 Cellulose synthase operon protein C [Thermodesulfovibrio sp. N1]